MKTFLENFLPFAADATPEQMDSGELVKHVDDYPPGDEKKKKKKLRQKSFKEHINEKFKIESDPQYDSVRKKAQQGFKVWRGKRGPPADPGDFGTGPYYSTSHARARMYGGRENTTQYNLQFKNPLVLTVQDAYKKLTDSYKTVRGEIRGREARAAKLAADLRQQGYDAIISVDRGKNSPRYKKDHDRYSELEVVDLRREERDYDPWADHSSQMYRNPIAAHLPALLAKHQDLRYVYHDNQILMGDARVTMHDELTANLNNLQRRKPLMYGFIDKNDLPAINSHPQKLSGWILDRHMKKKESGDTMWDYIREGYDAETMILRSRVIPAARDKEGKVHIGLRGFTHGFILARLKKNSNPNTKGLDYGYHDPLTKKFYTRTALGFDATELPEFKKRWEEYLAEELADYEKTILKSRVIPALKHPITGKIHLGKRGQDHIDLADSIFNKDKEGLKHYTELKHSGYYDPPTKKFYSRGEAGFDSSEIMTGFQRMRKYGTEEFKTFGQFLGENYKNTAGYKKDLSYLKKEREHLLPALKGRVTGKIILGKPRDIHWDIALKNGIKIYDVDDADRNKPIITGFWHKKNKKFIETKVSTLDLLSPLQRMKEFGTESFKTFGEFINESQWDKYVYHATYADNFKPHVGMHVGTLHAAMARAHQTSNDAGKNDFGRPLHIHAFRYNTKGKSASIIDHTDESGSPTEMITHEPRDVAGYLNRQKVIKTRQEKPFQGQTHETIGAALKEKGITHLSYRNTYEDPGSTSHMIYDPESLQHVHTFEAPKFAQRYKNTDKPYFDKTPTQRKLGKTT